jgi:PiT family inorganic phosphate transporter
VSETALVVVIVIVALSFDYTNGFHDSANAIATSVSTRALTPRVAVSMAAVANVLGALVSTKVARTVGAGIIDPPSGRAGLIIVASALLGAIAWNLGTWYFGLPSSSSYALIGGLVGAALIGSDGVKWSGLVHKVIIPMITSPLLGFAGGFIVMGALFALTRNWQPLWVNRVFGKAQLVSATYMGWAHGFADGQKTMGVMALALFAAGKSVDWEHVPSWLQFDEAAFTARVAELPKRENLEFPVDEQLVVELMSR